MQHLASKLVGSSILSYHSGKIIGKVTSFIVNKTDLKIELLVLLQPESKEKKYLSTNDVRSAIDDLVIINSEDDISDKEDLIRHKNLIDSGFKVINSKVMTQEGKKLGVARDFTIDYDNFTLLKMYVKQNLISRITKVNLIIDRKQIIEVEKNKIIVKSTAIKAKQKQQNSLPAKAT